MSNNQEYGSDIGKLIEAGGEIVFNFGNPTVGKTCFLMTMYEYFRINQDKWDMRTNPHGNYQSVKRITDFVRAVKKSGQLPPATLGGEVHELDILISPVGINHNKLFIFLDMSGEDMKSYLETGILQMHNKQYLLKDLNTSFFYFVTYDETVDEDLDLPILLDYIWGADDIDFDRFALVISQWDKNSLKTNGKFNKTSEFLKTEMPATWKKMEYLSTNNIDVNAFRFSIGNVTYNDLTKKNELNKGFDTTFCPKIAAWLYAKYNDPLDDEPQKPGFWKLFIQHTKSLLT